MGEPSSDEEREVERRVSWCRELVNRSFSTCIPLSCHFPVQDGPIAAAFGPSVQEVRNEAIKSARLLAPTLCGRSPPLTNLLVCESPLS